MFFMELIDFSFMEESILDENATKMLEIWNYHLGHKVRLFDAEPINIKLAELYIHKFNSNMAEWDYFIHCIMSSRKLMNSEWKINYAHILSWKTIDEILEGKWGVRLDLISNSVKQKISRSTKVAPGNSIGSLKLEDITAEIMENASCESEKEVRLAILEKITLEEYKSWFREAVFKDNKLETANLWRENMWEYRFRNLVEGGLISINGYI